jgi:hypothetical protein
VSWNDAVAFAAWLSRKEGKTYRLPTEAEWEYACRAGSPPQHPSSGDAIEPGEDARHLGGFTPHTHPVDRMSPNAWGLYGMLGNVNEWCADWFDVKYYASSPAADPPGAALGPARIRRGSDYWANGPLPRRPAYRSWLKPDSRQEDLGFRVALDRPGTPKASITNTPSAPTNTAGSNGNSSASAAESPDERHMHFILGSNPLLQINPSSVCYRIETRFLTSSSRQPRRPAMKLGLALVRS